MYYYPNNINKNNINILMYFSYPEKAVAKSLLEFSMLYV